jgi:CRP-like cAMP-binding protein
VVPNANLLSQNIVVLGKRTGQPMQHRIWVYFNVDFHYAPSLVIEAVHDALVTSPIDGVADDPKPSVVCVDFANNREGFARYAVRYWLSDLANDDPTSSRVRSRIYAALQRAGIPLARPIAAILRPEEDPVERQRRLKQERLQAIERIELFRSLTPAERDFVAEHLTHAPFAAGEICTQQGAVAHWLYVLSVGKVEIRRRLEPSENAAGKALSRGIAVIDAPDFFGEMGLMTGEPRTADVVAITDVECFRFDKSALQQILAERPEVAAEFSKTLARRRVELTAALEGLDADARRVRTESEETRILDRIQQFFGLTRTTKV